MNGDRPTEVTALLDRVRSPDVQIFPSISPTLAHVSTLDVQHITADDLCPHDLADCPPEVRVAYSLIVLLKLREERLRKRPRTHNLWELWKELEENANDVELLDVQIASAWNMFLAEYRNAVEIEDVLWLAFPEDQSATARNLRVIDFLHVNDGPKALVVHRLVHLSLLRRWKQGAIPEDTFASISPRIFVDRYDNLGTPRIFHFLELVCQTVYLYLLAWYLLYPPIVSIVEPSFTSDHGMREIFIILLSLSLTAQAWSSLSIPPFLVFAAFMLSLPTIPIPGTSLFAILHVAFALHIYQLHLPVPSSPLFLYQPDSALPLASLFNLSTNRVLWPALKFFFPVFILILVLLSYSLVDTFSFKIMDFALTLPIPSLSALPPPAETRSAFLSVLILILILYLSSLALLTAILPKTCASHSVERWDRYTKPVGLEARRAFIFATNYYSAAYTFPPPLNLLQLVFVRFPTLVARLIRVDHHYITDFNKNLWRISVGPLVASLSLVLWTISHT